MNEQNDWTTDEARGCKWRQGETPAGRVFTDMVMLDTGWSCRSLRFEKGKVDGTALDSLVEYIREIFGRRKSKTQEPPG